MIIIEIAYLYRINNAYTNTLQIYLRPSSRLDIRVGTSHYDIYKKYWGLIRIMLAMELDGMLNLLLL